MSIVKAEFIDSRDVRPFVKWAGEKGQLLSELNKKIPRQFNRYFEPFLGGGAVFLRLASKNMISTAFLSDTNEELIKAFKVVRDSVGELIKVLNDHREEYYKNPTEYYHTLRDATQPGNDIEIAARFVALNKTCFNGLYRVNQNGKFNVPMGDYKKPLICDSSNLKNVSSVLVMTLMALHIIWVLYFFSVAKERSVYFEWVHFDILTFLALLLVSLFGYGIQSYWIVFALLALRTICDYGFAWKEFYTVYSV